LFLVLATACAHGAGGIVGDPPAASPAIAPEAAREPPAAAESATEPQLRAQPMAPLEREIAREPDVVPAPAPVAEADARERLVRAARGHLRRRFAGDCSAFVRRVYAEAGVALPALTAARSMTESLYRSMSPVPRPQPGDLAYFRRTRRDRGARDRDRLTHVAIVEAVDGASVIMIHRGSRGIRRLAMNLEHPHDPDENGIVRRRRAGDRAGTPSLAGELFAGYSTAFRGKPEASESSRVEGTSSRPRRLKAGRRAPRG
jgi:hypothetical protein